MEGNCGTPKRQCEQNQLSLRSRTIQNSTKFKSSSIKYPRHKNVDEISSSYSLNSFPSLPAFKTPPSAVKRIVPLNPFNVGLRERLMNSTVSPTIFSRVLSPSQNSEEMRWTIEDLSLIKPAPIDENIQPWPEHDEVEVQEVIEKYFSETHLVPSPYDPPRNCISLNSAETPPLVKMSKQAVASTPRLESDEGVRSRDVLVQTALSLPPTLPENVEAVLRPFFNTVDGENVDTTENVFNASSMRRKLFFHQSDEQLSPVRFNSEIGSQKTELFTPVHTSQSRHYTPNASSQEFAQAEPDISPIQKDRSFSSSMCKSRARLSFIDSPDQECSKHSLIEKRSEDFDHLMEVNSLVDEPMMVSIVDVTIANRVKKRHSSDGDIKPLISTKFNKGSRSNSDVVPSISDDKGYCTNDEIHWKHSLSDKGKSSNPVQISFLAASTPSKKNKIDEIF